jgi:hypothetical protein
MDSDIRFPPLASGGKVLEKAKFPDSTQGMNLIFIEIQCAEFRVEFRIKGI